MCSSLSKGLDVIVLLHEYTMGFNFLISRFLAPVLGQEDPQKSTKSVRRVCHAEDIFNLEFRLTYQLCMQLQWKQEKTSTKMNAYSSSGRNN